MVRPALGGSQGGEVVADGAAGVRVHRIKGAGCPAFEYLRACNNVMAAPSSVSYVGFSLSGDDDHTRDSYAAVTSWELYTAAHTPTPGGAYDLRLGTTDHGFLCLTCAHGKKLCPGHRGHLDLKVAVVQPIAVAEVRRWLRVACHACGAIIVDREKYERLPAARRLEEASSTTTEGKVCRCGAVHPKIAKDAEDHFTFWAEPPGGAAAAPAVARQPNEPFRPERRGRKLYPDTIRAILERIADADVEALGRGAAAHPRKLVLRVVCVPPNTIRPGVRSFGGGSGASYHDSTNLLQHLVKRNSTLPDRLPDAMGPLGPAGGAVDDALDRAVQNLQQIYYDLVAGSSATSVTQGSGGRRGLVVGSRAVSSFLRNLPRKEGRIRANMLGRRVCYISRSTISGNTALRIDQVGVPLEFARMLQVKETVQAHNRDWLMPFFLNGRRQYPGSTIVVRRATGEAHDVSGLRDFRLEAGDVLYRDLIDGDAVFFNRQPTLERSSIGVHRAVVTQDPSIHTFQMNVLSCEGYNADFDGDQMNLWAAREPAPRAEAMYMSAIANWFFSSKTSGPVNGQVQDSVVGCHELTRSHVRVDKYHAMGLFAGLSGLAALGALRFDTRPPGETYTGRELASLVFAATPVDYRGAPSSYSDVYAPYLTFDPDETLTVVERGRLVRGVLDKKSVGAKASGGLFHLVGREYGPQRAIDAIFALQQVALQFLLRRGFSVGTADLVPTPAARDAFRRLMAGVVLESHAIGERLLRGAIVPPIGSTVREFHERLQINALKLPETEMLRWILGQIRPDTNGFFRMVADGSKGTNPNLFNVMSGIGQTIINGERVREQFGFRRTLPYFPRFALAPEAGGFVKNSYIGGMTSGEYIFQDMNGRFDLLTKALTTSVTGYFMRKGVMVNQSSVVDNHRRVTKDSRVVQFLYGENGADTRHLERVALPTVDLDDDALRRASWVDVAAACAPSPPGDLADAQAAVDAAAAAVAADRDDLRRAAGRIAATNFGFVFDEKILLPVNVARIVASVRTAADHATPTAAAHVPPTAAALAARVARVADLCRRLPYAYFNEIQERRGAPVPRHLAAGARLTAVLVRAVLAPPALVSLSDEQLAYIVEVVRQRFAESLVDYGTAVGVIAPQAVSEPLTQYMLDSHHRSVGGGTSKVGLVRINEIFSAQVVAKERSASMSIAMRAPGGTPGGTASGTVSGTASGSMAAAAEFANSIEHVSLRRFVRHYDVLLEPAAALVYPPYAADAEWIEAFSRAHPLVRPPGDLTNWCLRFAVDKAALVLKAVDLELVVRRLRARHVDLHVVHTPEASPDVVVRAWLRSGAATGAGPAEARVRAYAEAVLDTPIRGVRGVARAAAEAVERRRVGSGGAYEKTSVAVVRTSGTNLYSAFLHDGVDAAATITSSIGDTYDLLGIEAARAKIVSETRAFMEDSTPNLAHLYLYADEMTTTGRYTSVERGGLTLREHNNIFLRMTYGAPVQVVTNAALTGARSKIYGLAAPQLLGAVPQIGTLYNALTVDEAFVRANTVSVDSILNAL